MVTDTLKTTVSLFRPLKKNKTDARTTFEKTTVSAVKLSQPSSAWVTDSTGEVQSKAGSIFYNIGISSEYPELDPLFKVGDFICEETDSDTPPKERQVVQRVTEQTFKGKLHHIEVVLV